MLYKSSLRLIISLFILQLTYSLASKHVPRFEVSSIDSRSVVVRILGARNVTRFDMTVQIFDLDRLKEFRKSELSTARYEDQLFSFDGLTSSTWFAIRIQYRLIYRTDDGFADFSTKQEFIVRTKDEAERNRSELQKGLLIRPPPDELVQLENIASDSLHINVTMTLAFPLRSKVHSVIVPELKCKLGTIKPPAQQLHSTSVEIHFDLRRLLALQRQPTNSPYCHQLCIYPFVRAEIDGKNEAFRAREWCGSLEEAYELVGAPLTSAASAPITSIYYNIIACVLFTLFIKFRVILL